MHVSQLKQQPQRKKNNKNKKIKQDNKWRARQKSNKKTPDQRKMENASVVGWG